MDLPDLVLILSGDHIYTMDYEPMISFHLDHQADLTIGTIRVPIEEASRFGVLSADDEYRVTSFVEKPENPPSNLANMGVYLFNRDLLDKVLWEDKDNKKSSHDFGKDIIPGLLKVKSARVCFPLHRLLDGCGHPAILLAGPYGYALASAHRSSSITAIGSFTPERKNARRPVFLPARMFMPA